MTLPNLRDVKLTQFARGGGCAAKLRLRELATVLDTLATPKHRDGIDVDHEFSDDAAIVHVTAGSRLVLTADVIAPLVDDPRTFGAIAATNAMSDVWAMGGQPRFALNLVFFPDELLPLEVLHEVLAGGAEACARAGVAVVGGHTVRDPELKFGLSVTGEIAPHEVLSNRGARAGDVLILSKAQGTGVMSQAIKGGVASASEIAAAVTSMTTLNRDALAVARRHDVSALTDVTGFGLCGHLRNLLRGSNLIATIDLEAMPLLPGVHTHAAAGKIPGGSKANRAFLSPRMRWASDDAPVAEFAADSSERELLASLACDAQTSGGLLLCIPRRHAEACVDELKGRGMPASIVGELATPTADAPVETMRLR